MEENRRLDGRDLMIAFLYYCNAINIGVVIGHKVLLAEEEKIGTRRGSDGGNTMDLEERVSSVVERNE